MKEAHYRHSENHSRKFHEQIVPPPPQDNSSVCTGEGWGKVEVVRLTRLSWQPHPQKAMPSRWRAAYWGEPGASYTGLLGHDGGEMLTEAWLKGYYVHLAGRATRKKKGSGAANLMKGGDGRKRSGVFNYSQITHRLDRSCFKGNPWKWCGHQQPSALLSFLPQYLSSWNLIFFFFNKAERQ